MWPNGGQNTLNGGAVGGIDTVNYNMGYKAGVTINLVGGGPSGGNQDSIIGFTNAVGTAFNDTMIGTDVVAGTNGANRLQGGKGADEITGNAGPDTIQGGAGNDTVRAGSGDDTVKLQGGKDYASGGGGDDFIDGGKGKDKCLGGKGDDVLKHCEKGSHKANVAKARVAHLTRMAGKQ